METKILKVNPKALKLLEVNARYMKAQEFNLLVDNVKRDGKLTSVPFSCHTDEYWEWVDSGKEGDKPKYSWEVLSGNHRTQAAIEAEIEEIEIMATNERLTKDQKIAIALSHNSISGQDDAAILKQMYESIQDIEYKAYSGLDDETLQLLEKVGNQSMSSIGLDYQVLNLVILPTEKKVAMELIDKIKKEVNKNTALTLRFSEYDKWLDRMEDVSSATGIKNTATVFLAMLDIVSNHLDELADVWLKEGHDKQWVPLSTLTGRPQVKIGDGRVIHKAIEKLISTGEIDKNKKEQSIAILAQKYLDSMQKEKTRK